MKRLAFSLALLTIGLPPAFGWNLEDHRDMARLVLEDIAHDEGLDEPVEIRPLASLLDKLKAIRPEIADAWQFSHYLRINPKVDIGTFESLRFPQGSPIGQKS